MSYYAAMKNFKFTDKQNTVESQKAFCLSKETKHRSAHTVQFIFTVFEVLEQARLSYCDLCQNTVCFSWNELTENEDEGNFQEANRHGLYFEGGGGYMSINICKLH